MKRMRKKGKKKGGKERNGGSEGVKRSEMGSREVEAGVLRPIGCMSAAKRVYLRGDPGLLCPPCAPVPLALPSAHATRRPPKRKRSKVSSEEGRSRQEVYVSTYTNSQTDTCCSFID